MKIKLSGVLLLGAGFLIIIFCFLGVVKILGFHGLFLFSDEVVLPQSLAVKNSNRAWASKGRLTGSWTPLSFITKGYFLEALPLENGAILEVKCNQNENYIYSVDSQGQLFYKDAAVTNTDKWPSCSMFQVRAAHLTDIGKPYVISQVSASALTRPLPQTR